MSFHVPRWRIFLWREAHETDHREGEEGSSSSDVAARPSQSRIGMFDFSTASENLEIRLFVFSMACLGDATDRETGAKSLGCILVWCRRRRGRPPEACSSIAADLDVRLRCLGLRMCRHTARSRETSARGSFLPTKTCTWDKTWGLFSYFIRRL
jgi:hypothetical protein